MPTAHALGNAQATVSVWASVWLVQGGQTEGTHAPGGWQLQRARTGARPTKVKQQSFYRGRLFCNAVAKCMGIFSNRQEAAFSDVLRILTRQ